MGILIIIYINNMLIISKDKAKIKALKKSLIKRFKMEDLGPIKYFIGKKLLKIKRKGQLPYTKMYILARSLNNII